MAYVTRPNPFIGAGCGCPGRSARRGLFGPKPEAARGGTAALPSRAGRAACRRVGPGRRDRPPGPRSPTPPPSRPARTQRGRGLLPWTGPGRRARGPRGGRRAGLRLGGRGYREGATYLRLRRGSHRGQCRDGRPPDR